MRPMPLIAALVMLSLLPSAAAGGSSLSLTGPSEAIKAEGPTSATLKLALTLQGVTCVGTGEIPVDLKIVETKGLRSASLTWERVLFKVAAGAGSTQPWTGRSEVGLRIWGAEPTGHAKVLASYTLPSNCVGTGAASGEAAYTLRVLGPPPPAEPVRLPEPAAVPRSESVLTPPVQASESSARIAKPTLSLPVPVLGAIAGMCAGGLVVFWKRARLAGSG